MKELVITIKPDGSIEIDAVGYSGGECYEASRPYEGVGRVMGRKEKPEARTGCAGVKRGVHSGTGRQPGR